MFLEEDEGWGSSRDEAATAPGCQEVTQVSPGHRLALGVLRGSRDLCWGGEWQEGNGMAGGELKDLEWNGMAGVGVGRMGMAGGEYEE